MKSVIGTRASYGARRVRAIVNRDFGTGYNLKRIARLMDMKGWKLPRSMRRRSGRAHTGLIRRAISNERWSSDVLEISCWNGEHVPARSPQSNGMSEAFVNTIKRDYVAGADRSTAAAVLEQISSWVEDYNAVAPTRRWASSHHWNTAGSSNQSRK
jgi:transposase InsO family protein